MRFTRVAVETVESDTDIGTVEHIENVEFEMVYDPVGHDRHGRLIKDGKTIRSFASVTFLSMDMASLLAEAYEPDQSGAFHRKVIRLFS